MLLSEKQWKTLVKELQQQRCILLLGNRAAVAVDQNGRRDRLSVLLSRHLAQQLDAEEVSYKREHTDNLAYISQRFLSAPKTRRIDLEDEVSDFYTAKTRELPDFYTWLAKLPFSIVVNLSPDNYPLRAMRQAGKAGVQSAHYNFRKERDQTIEAPSPGKPLVYNLLGTIDDPESLILTEEDRVEFIKNVVKGNPDIPNAVMSHFDERKTYVFLGLNLDNWDYRLLFDTLKLSRENLSFLPQPVHQPLTPEARFYYEERYRVMFIDADLEEFVKSMEQHYTEAALETPPDQPLVTRRVFLLFNPNEADTRFVQALSAHLSAWVNRGALEIWHEGMLLGGEMIEETTRMLAAADAILPVLSAAFWADEKITSFWLPEALRQHHERGLRILPLLHRACDFEETELSGFPILPTGNKPLRNWPDEDEAFKNIVHNLKILLYE